MISRSLMVLVVVGIVIAWIWGARPRDPPEAISRSARVVAEREVLDADVAALPESEAATRTPTQPGRPIDSLELPAAPDPQRVVLHGTWAVVDTVGIEREGCDGHFVIRLYDAREDVEIVVTDGKWSVELPPKERFDVLRVELDGQPTAKVGYMNALGIPEDRNLRLVGRWMRPVVLTVLDATTRRQLSGLTSVGEGMGVPWEHPGTIDQERVLVSDAASPVVLPIPEYPDDHQSLWVRGPDHGWGHIVVHSSVGGDFVLALHPSGRLSVTIEGAAPGVVLSLRLRRNGDAEDWEGIRYEETIGERTRLEFDSLAAGHYVVTAELGHRYRTPRILAAEPVDLAGGDDVEVLLDVSSFVPPALTEIAGTLHVPPAWRFQRFGIHSG